MPFLIETRKLYLALGDFQQGVTVKIRELKNC